MTPRIRRQRKNNQNLRPRRKIDRRCLLTSEIIPPKNLHISSSFSRILTIELEEGDLHFMRYEPIAHLLAGGAIHLV